MIEITLIYGKKIEATAEHPFYIKGKGWNPAGSLKLGQALVLHNGTTVVVEEVDSRVRLVRVFNFSVANAHNYFVGGDGVLVHNVDTKNLKYLVEEARSVLGIGDKYKTTAIGILADGSLAISSSDPKLPKPQRIWAIEHGIKIIESRCKDVHAEEILIKKE